MRPDKFFPTVGKWFGIALAMLALVSPAYPEWKEKVLYSFQGGPNDGATPAGGVVFDSSGNLYGATTQGGGGCPIDQCGTVFELTPPQVKGRSWTETVLHIFKGNTSGDGNTPAGGVILDSAGNLYGTTAYGGNGNCVLLGTKAGCGTVFELSPPKQKGGAWTETVLYSFQGGNDGYFPNGNLVFDKAGKLYGATMFGGGKGTSCNPYYQYCGTVFELSPPKRKSGKWIEKVLHSFAGVDKGGPPGDGANPNGGLVLDSEGAIYGTTQAGGLSICAIHENQGCGTAFEVDPPMENGGQWTERVIHAFGPSEGGVNPAAGVTLDRSGYLYGTTDGTVFRFGPSKSGIWKETILYTFDLEAYNPEGALIFDASGNLYGTTSVGTGRSARGSVFEMKRPRDKGGVWALRILHGFTGIPDGENPDAGLISDKAGNLYSVTQYGGSGSGCGFTGCGAVFEVLP